LEHGKLYNNRKKEKFDRSAWTMRKIQELRNNTPDRVQPSRDEGGDKTLKGEGKKLVLTFS